MLLDPSVLTQRQQDLLTAKTIQQVVDIYPGNAPANDPVDGADRLIRDAVRQTRREVDGPILDYRVQDAPSSDVPAPSFDVEHRTVDIDVVNWQAAYSYLDEDVTDLTDIESVTQDIRDFRESYRETYYDRSDRSAPNGTVSVPVPVPDVERIQRELDFLFQFPERHDQSTFTEVSVPQGPINAEISSAVLSQQIQAAANAKASADAAQVDPHAFGVSSACGTAGCLAGWTVIHEAETNPNSDVIPIYYDAYTRLRLPDNGITRLDVVGAENPLQAALLSPVYNEAENAQAAAEMRDRLDGPYNRLHSREEGWGRQIGLAVVYRDENTPPVGADIGYTTSDFSRAAQPLLGLTPLEADLMFAGDNTLQQMYAFAVLLTGGGVIDPFEPDNAEYAEDLRAAVEHERNKLWLRGYEFAGTATVVPETPTDSDTSAESEQTSLSDSAMAVTEASQTRPKFGFDMTDVQDSADAEPESEFGLSGNDDSAEAALLRIRTLIQSAYRGEVDSTHYGTMTLDLDRVAAALGPQPARNTSHVDVHRSVTEAPAAVPAQDVDAWIADGIWPASAVRDTFGEGEGAVDPRGDDET